MFIRVASALRIADCFAGPVARVLVQIGQRVEHRGFPDVRVACYGYYFVIRRFSADFKFGIDNVFAD